jgi:hypothetical protein
MFGLQDVSSGEFFDTGGVTIDFVIKSPVFRTSDNEDGSLVFNMVLPPTDKNLKLTKFLDRIESFNNQVNEIAVYGWIKGMHVWTGTALAKFSRPDGIECSVGFGRGEFNYLAEGKKLSDVVPDEIHQIGIEQLYTDWNTGVQMSYIKINGFDDVVSKIYPEVNYAVFPVKTESLTESLGTIVADWYNKTPVVNFWDMANQRFFRNDIGTQFWNLDQNNGNKLTVVKRNNIFMPFVYNAWVFKNIFKSLGYFVENNPFETNEDLKRLVLFNIQTINKLTYKYEYHPENPQYANQYYYGLEPSTEFNLRDHVPDILIKDYIRAIEDMFFLRCFIDNKTKRVRVLFLKDIVNSTKYRDISDRVSGIKERKLEYDKICKLVQTYDSADSIGGFKTPGEFNDVTRVADSFFKTDLPDNVAGSFENKISLAKLEQRFYVANSCDSDLTHVSKWEAYCWNYFLEKYVQETGKELTAAAAGIVNTYFFDYLPDSVEDVYEWYIPYVIQKLKFKDTTKTKDNSCGIRFMFYRGMQDGKKGLMAPNNDYYGIKPGYNNAAIDWLVAYQLPHAWAVYLLGKLQGVDGYYTKAEIISFAYTHVSSGADYATVETFMNYFINTYCYVACHSFYRVLQTTKYPFGTNDVYDAFGNKIPEANLSLKLDGEFGIYENLAKPFVDLVNKEGKPVTLKYTPTLEDIYFNFPMKQRSHGINYIADELRGSYLPIGEFAEGELDCMSC